MTNSSIYLYQKIYWPFGYPLLPFEAKARLYIHGQHDNIGENAHFWRYRQFSSWATVMTCPQTGMPINTYITTVDWAILVPILFHWTTRMGCYMIQMLVRTCFWRHVSQAVSFNSAYFEAFDLGNCASIYTWTTLFERYTKGDWKCPQLIDFDDIWRCRFSFAVHATK